MTWQTVSGVVFLAVFALPACSSDAVRRALYEAAYQTDCVERTGSQNCDPGHQTYDDYQKDKAAALKPDNSSSR